MQSVGIEGGGEGTFWREISVGYGVRLPLLPGSTNTSIAAVPLHVGESRGKAKQDVVVDSFSNEVRMYQNHKMGIIKTV